MQKSSSIVLKNHSKNRNIFSLTHGTLIWIHFWKNRVIFDLSRRYCIKEFVKRVIPHAQYYMHNRQFASNLLYFTTTCMKWFSQILKNTLKLFGKESKVLCQKSFLFYAWRKNELFYTRSGHFRPFNYCSTKYSKKATKRKRLLHARLGTHTRWFDRILFQDIVEIW